MLYIAESTIPSQSANSIQVMRMCQAFKQYGSEIELVVPWYPHKLITQPRALFNIANYYGIQTKYPIRFLPGPRMQFGKIRVNWFDAQALWYAQMCKPSLIYTRSLTFAAALVNKDLPTIVECHEYELFRDRGDLAVLMQVAHSPLLRSIVVISANLKRLYVEYGLPEEKIFVAHDGVNEQFFLENHTPSTISRQTLNIPKDQPIICYTGKLTADRGISLLLEAAKAIPQAFFLLVGGRQSELEFWQAQIDADRIDNVRLVGFVPPFEVVHYLRLSDVLVAPYTTKIPTINAASPLKVFEYLATGKPSVISDLQTVREVVVDGFDSILVKPDSVESLIDGLNRALQSESRQLGQNARQTARRYTWQARAEHILEAADYE